MKLTSDNETLARNRALILYILNKVSKPISNDALFNLVLSIENMNYFYFQQFLLDLSESKYILSYVSDHVTIYELTNEGKKTLELVNDLIPGVVKFKVDNNLKSTLGNIENKLSVSADFTPESENSYIVTCKIVENNTVLFELKTFAGSREQAKIIVQNWNKNARKPISKNIRYFNKEI